jgi:phosphate:Na+ symporter
MKMVEEAFRCLAENTLKWEDSIRRREELVDELQEDITEYIAELTGRPLTEKESSIVPELMHAVHDAERVGDLAINIFELAETRIRKSITLSKKAIDDLHEMFNVVDQQCGHVVEALRTGNADLSREAVAEEHKINDLQRRLSGRHMKRLESGACSPRSGILFLDIVTNLERIGDHLVNIAERIPAIAPFEPDGREKD